MFSKALKQTFGMAFIMAFLAGCSTTSTTTDNSSNGANSSGSSSSAVSTTNAEKMTNLDTVFYFDFDQSVLKPEARAALTAHASNLKMAPASTRLEGHADELGTREYNMALGERRAKAVRDFLVLQGVDSALLETISYGEERLASGSNEMNRRVEMK